MYKLTNCIYQVQPIQGFHRIAKGPYARQYNPLGDKNQFRIGRYDDTCTTMLKPTLYAEQVTQPIINHSDLRCAHST